LTRRYIRIRFEPSLFAAASRIIDLRTGRDIAGRVPIGYAPALCAAAPGSKVKASIFGERPRLAYTRRGRARRLWREPVLFKVVEVGGA